jgi:cyclophilin family peptidyl-prolyl cis-trans isomerase
MKLKRILSLALATVATSACVATFSSCETARPEVEITISFQGETYELDYVLYRKIAPATVAHFLALADEGYFNDLCVHDYSDNRLYTGGYKYTATAGAEYGGLIYQNYYEFVRSREIPTTVFDAVTGAPTYTLYGEFASNSFEVENGNLKEEYGSLGMFYTLKDAGAVSVNLKHPEAGESNNRDYKYNSATSLFFISLTSTTKTNSDYCTFAKIDEDSVEELRDLDESVAEYVENNDAATERITVDIDKDDAYFSEHQNRAYYEVLSSPIIIKSVEVKKF